MPYRSGEIAVDLRPPPKRGIVHHSRPPLRRLSATISIVALLGACGGDADDPTAATVAEVTEDVASDVTGEAAYDEADVAFLRDMIPHHRGAVEMSAAALDPAADAGPDVVDLASRIENAQDGEIEEMTALLEEWGEPVDDPDGGGSETMDDEMGSMDMGSTSFTGLRGDDFDAAWLEAMLEHHRGAVEMGRAELADGIDPQTRALAETIIDAQTAEITEMEALLD